MSENVEPPSYAASNADPPSYPSPLPATFRVGVADTSPLLTIEEVEAHLRILGAFSQLKANVEAANSGATAPLKLDAPAAWTVFLCRAVYRFERWILTAPTLDQDRALPPLDVLMVWHSYMLVGPHVDDWSIL